MGVKLIRIGLEQDPEFRQALEYTDRREEFFAQTKSEISKLGYKHVLIDYRPAEMAVEIIVSDLEDPKTPQAIIVDVAAVDDPEVSRILEAINLLFMEFKAFRNGESLGISILTQQLLDRDLAWQKRRESATRLRQCPEESVADALIAAVKEDPNGNVRERAIHALAYIITSPDFSDKTRKAKEVADAVMKVLVSDKNQKVTKAAWWFLDLCHPNNDVFKVI